VSLALAAQRLVRRPVTTQDHPTLPDLWTRPDVWLFPACIELRGARFSGVRGSVQVRP